MYTFLVHLVIYYSLYNSTTTFDFNHRCITNNYVQTYLIYKHSIIRLIKLILYIYIYIYIYYNNMYLVKPHIYLYILNII